jgi:hypothetical protein
MVPRQAAPQITVLPLELQVGDHLDDNTTGGWMVLGRPFTTHAGRTVHVRVVRARDLGLTQIRSWGVREQVDVRRATSAESK